MGCRIDRAVAGRVCCRQRRVRWWWPWRANDLPTVVVPLSRYSLSELQPKSPASGHDRGRRAAASGAGCCRTPCVPGATSAGSFRVIHTSWSWPVQCSTCTPAAGRASRSWADEYVLSADEKTSIQARRRLQPTLPAGPHQAARVEHEYERQGALQYLAAWDVHRAVVFGRCEPKTGKAAFGRLVDQVMDQEPYRSARRVFWIVDNGSSHRGERAAEELRARHPRIVIVHTPIHASWLNQIELYFSILQRKVLTPERPIPACDDLIERIHAFGRALLRARQALRLELHPPGSRTPPARSAPPPRPSTSLHTAA